ncbi:MAG: protease inhibitor I42 family protein [Streptosporangiaceae bacterium]
MSVLEVHDAGSQVRASVGDELVVRLAENAATGYQWRVGALAPALTVESSRLEIDGGGLGAASERVLRLRAVEPGQSTVRLTLERPWEQARPQGQFDFVVRVR